MRAGLVGYFDIGESYGLSDDVFPKDQREPEPDIGLVGINFPLGQGIGTDLLTDEPETVEAWRRAAVAQIARPELELSWSEDLDLTHEEYDAALRELLLHHRVLRARLRIHAVGTVYAELQLGPGVPLLYLEDVLGCLEYAAYTPVVADGLLEAAQRRVGRALGPRRTGLVELSQRDLPAEVRDAKGYVERPLFTSFTHVVACVDPGDEDEVGAVTELLDLEDEDIIEFELHGRLHYGWAACVLEARRLYGWENARQGPRESPEEQVMRMEADIHVAHIFLGTSEAFTRLFVSEIHEQVGGYIAKRAAGRTPQELNRLRTLALAVVNLTDFAQVAPSEEDQAYFRRFDASAELGRKHEAIQQATEVLYSVQVAETQVQDARRQRMLNIIVLLLTSLTIISVTADAYDFIRAEDLLIERRIERTRLLAEFVVGLVLIVLLASIATRAPRRSRR